MTAKSVMRELEAEAKERRKVMRAVKPSGQRLDYTTLTWGEMAEIIVSIWREMKRRNPIGINCYQSPMFNAVAAIDEIAKAEKYNPTCEAGPGIDKPKGKRK
jgi:hypothetical protein